MVRKILQIGDPVLEHKSQPVKNVKDPQIQELVRDLIETCKSKADITAGLSAPQVGVNVQVIVCRRMDIEDEKGVELADQEAWEVMINPEVLKTYGAETTYWEGCLSVGEGPEGLYAPVTRNDNVDVRYLAPDGSVKTLTCRGFFAHIVQHEIDHLNGSLFLRYVTDPAMIWKSRDLDAYYQKHGEYPQV